MPTTASKRLRRADTLWLGFVGVGAATVALYELVPSGAPQDYLYAGVGFASALAVAAGAFLHSRPRPLPWLLFAGGLALFASADTVMAGYGSSPPFPSAADALYVAGYPLLAAGALLLFHARDARRDVSAMLDAGILAAAVATLLWRWLLTPYAQETGIGTLGRVVLVLYPVGDLLVLAVAARLLLAGAYRVRSYQLLVASIVALLTADVVYDATVSSYTPGAPVDIGWLVSYVLWGAAALHPSAIDLTRRRPARPPTETAVLALVAVPLLLVVAGFVVESLRGAGPTNGEVAAGTVLVLLVFARLALAIVDGVRLHAIESSARRRLEIAHEQLAEREALTQALLAHTSDAIGIIDSGATIVFESPAVAEHLGYAPEELVGTSAFRLIHPDDLAHVAEVLARSLGTPRAVETVECRMCRKDGSWRTIELVGENLIGVPPVDGILTTARDVTEQREAEAALRASEALFRALTEQSFDLVSIYDAEGTITYESPSARWVLGYEPHELLGTKAFDLVHPDDLERALQVFTEGIETPDATRTEELRVRHKDGSWRILEVMGRNLLDDPAVRGVMTTARDLTPRREAQRALRESEERLRAIFEQAPVGMALMSWHENRFVRVNRAYCELTGYSEAELRRLPLERIARPDAVEADHEQIERVLRGETIEPLERRLVRKDGSEVDVLVSLSAIHDADGHVDRLVAQVQDITALRAAEAERERLLAAEREARTEAEQASAIVRQQNELLLEADQLKDELISVVSHDLRTPLTSIVGYLELVRTHEVGPLTDEQEHALEVIDRNAGRLLVLVDSLLFISRAEAGLAKLELEPLDVGAVAAQVVEAQLPKAAATGIDLRLAVEATQTISADRAHVAEVLENLLSNALKFTPAGGSVEVRVRPAATGVVLEVADTGIGISVGDRKHVFDRFFRGKRALAAPGIGLGLAIVKAIVDAHGGSVAIRGRPGHGTTFVVTLPFAPAPAAAAPQPEPTATRA